MKIYIVEKTLNVSEGGRSSVESVYKNYENARKACVELAKEGTMFDSTTFYKVVYEKKEKLFIVMLFRGRFDGLTYVEDPETSTVLEEYRVIAKETED